MINLTTIREANLLISILLFLLTTTQRQSVPSLTYLIKNRVTRRIISLRVFWKMLHQVTQRKMQYQLQWDFSSITLEMLINPCMEFLESTKSTQLVTEVAMTSLFQGTKVLLSYTRYGIPQSTSSTPTQPCLSQILIGTCGELQLLHLFLHIHSRPWQTLRTCCLPTGKKKHTLLLLHLLTKASRKVLRCLRLTLLKQNRLLKNKLSLLAIDLQTY